MFLSQENVFIFNNEALVFLDDLKVVSLQIIFLLKIRNINRPYNIENVRGLSTKGTCYPICTSQN